MIGTPLEPDLNNKKVLMRISFFSLLIGLVFITNAMGADNPDELYKQGRFAEAQTAYAGSDMEDPKDLRYRYNKGCAAYQNSDYKGAAAAFSSVLRRAKDDEMRFRASYNLGNTAYKDGDFGSAVDYFKQSLAYNPTSEDARHNLELALREAEKQKKSESEDSKTGQQKPPDSQEDKGKSSDTDKEGETSPDKDKDTDSKQSEDQEQGADKDQTGSGQEKKSEQQKAEGPEKTEKAEQETPDDLSGELKPLNSPAEEPENDKGQNSYISKIDKRKAEALLDNIKEDRSEFMRFQIPEEKKHGIQSGKDW